MSCSQIRIGPFNLGYYGLFSSIINGCNLIIAQFMLPKLHFTFKFQLITIVFFIVSLFCYNIIYPFFLVDVYLSLVLTILVSSLSILSIILLAFSGCSKYSMLGCVRLISQLISIELLGSTIVLLYGFTFNDLSISIIWYTCSSWFTYSRINDILIFLYFIIPNNNLFLILFSIAILAETNRIPSDLPESESELVAGFITEYSSVYYSIIVLTEYANIICLSLLLIILHSLPPEQLLLLLLRISATRSTLVRLKFDELMINVWIILLPIISWFLLFTLLFCF